MPGKGLLVHFLKYWSLPVLYMGLIFYLSSLSKPPMPELEWDAIDKVYHLIEYAVLGFLVGRALLNASPKIFRFSPWISAFLLGSLYAASDEWHQSFVVGRYSSITDWIADCLGCVLGVLAMYVWYQRSKEKRRAPEGEES